MTAAHVTLALETSAAIFISRLPDEALLITKGLALAKKAGAVTYMSENTYSVQGSATRYTVAPGSCTCPARKRCYHRWAVNLLAKADLLPLAPEPPLAPLPRAETLSPDLSEGGFWVGR